MLTRYHLDSGNSDTITGSQNSDNGLDRFQLLKIGYWLIVIDD